MSNNITLNNLYSVGLSQFEKKYEKIFNKFINDDDAKTKLKTIFELVLNNNDINLVYFDMILTNVITMNINPFEIVYQSFNDKCLNIYNLFLNEIKNNKFTNNLFTRIYTDYIKNCIFIKKLFFKLNKLCITYTNDTNDTNDNKKNKMNTIYILSNYAFYKNIFDKKYNDKYLNEYIELKNIGTTEKLDEIIMILILILIQLMLIFMNLLLNK
jgi:hypothetical protein